MLYFFEIRLNIFYIESKYIHKDIDISIHTYPVPSEIYSHWRWNKSSMSGRGDSMTEAIGKSKD